MSKILSFEQEFIKQQPNRPQVLRFMREAIGKNEIQWEDMTSYNLSLVRTHICAKVAGNSACTYLGIIKAFLANYIDEKIYPCKNPYKELKAKRVPSQHIALTEDEVKRFDGYVPKTDNERDVKILFMRGCLTGARMSDAMNLSMKNINEDVLNYVSQKTKMEVVQPVHKMLAKYLRQQPAKEHKRADINRILRSICKRIGINEEVSLFVAGKMKTGPKYEFVSMHTSRRTFCSCLAIREVPVSVISKLAGHSTTNMTDRYICINAKKPADKAMQFFNGE